MRYYGHVKTGAELLSLENDDENKVSSINFRTPPSDSTGVPHIMEHAVLGGSRKYPVKEPFVELLKGSLKTFVNAFTYPDKTCYPVASQNAKDFYNLIDVYLDAVFYPLIPLHTLQQEGWHYELDKVEDPLVYKGIVFNEMKGSFSSPDNLLGLKSHQLLFPDTSYAFVSGGDPEKNGVVRRDGVRPAPCSCTQPDCRERNSHSGYRPDHTRGRYDPPPHCCNQLASQPLPAPNQEQFLVSRGLPARTQGETRAVNSDA